MTMSAAAVRDLLARQSGDPLILLLTVEHDEMVQPFRLCTNRAGEDIVSNGDTFTASPFDLGWPSDDEDTPVAELRCPNVDRLIGQALEELNGPAICTIQAVLASDPDTIEREALEFELRDAEWDGNSVTAQLSRARLVTEACPKYRITPRLFPGLFR